MSEIDNNERHETYPAAPPPPPAQGEEGFDQLPATTAPRHPPLRRPPFALISVGLILVVASWVPLVIFARAQVATSTDPRVQFFQDMGNQPKYREQQSNELFADARADRLPVARTVARGQLNDDDHYCRGWSRTGAAAPTFFDKFPAQVTVNAALVQRGQERFNIYCSPCHGMDGRGNGPVNQRIQVLKQNTDPAKSVDLNAWVQPADLTSEAVRARAVGHIYNTINVGIRNMPGYGGQVSIDDRWAIVAYVRALQYSQLAGR